MNLPKSGQTRRSSHLEADWTVGLPLQTEVLLERQRVRIETDRRGRYRHRLEQSDGVADLDAPAAGTWEFHYGRGFVARASRGRAGILAGFAVITAVAVTGAAFLVQPAARTSRETGKVEKTVIRPTAPSACATAKSLDSGQVFANSETLIQRVGTGLNVDVAALDASVTSLGGIERIQIRYTCDQHAKVLLIDVSRTSKGLRIEKATLKPTA